MAVQSHLVNLIPVEPVTRLLKDPTEPQLKRDMDLRKRFVQMLVCITLLGGVINKVMDFRQ